VVRSTTLPSLVAFIALVGCDLSEVEIPNGEPVVVVQGVMRPDLPDQFDGRQFIVVERSFTGEVGPVIDPETGDARFHEADSITIPYGGYPSTPIEDAAVWLRNVDFPEDSCGTNVQFVPNPTSHKVSEKPGLYWGPEGCPTMRPGDVLELRVESSEGEVVTGVTRVPGMNGAQLRVAGDSIPFDTATVTAFNRDTDTVRVVVDGVAARMLQVEVRRNGDLTDFGTKIYADTTAVGIPGDVINSFVIGDEDDVFRAGREYAFTVALTDSNYFDFARSENNQFTGRGFINRLSGGIGIFGSLVASTTFLRAVGQVEDPREGVYRLQGVFNDEVTVDLLWELYLARPVDSTEFSAFVEGPWMWGDVDTSADGFFSGNEFVAWITDTVGTRVRADTLRGVRQEGAWQVIVLDQCEGPTGFDRCAGARPIIFRGTMVQQELP
jgi:hypothetical protein